LIISKITECNFERGERAQASGLLHQGQVRGGPAQRLRRRGRGQLAASRHQLKCPQLKRLLFKASPVKTSYV
jgi:hypothetical protein